MLSSVHLGCAETLVPRLFRAVLMCLFCAATAFAARAQDCGCDITITKTGIYRPASQGTGTFYLNAQPGQTICIQAGLYQYLRFKDFQGSPDAPITVKNCGGQVKIGHNSYYAAMGFENCRYFHVTGTGDASEQYGFKIDSCGTSSALTVNMLSTDFEIDHVEVAKAGFAGMMVKSDPDCNSATWRENFTMRNVNIHHNYVHDTRGEGFYVGSTSYQGMARNCNGQTKIVLPHNIVGLKIHHNIVENAWADCLQYACAPDAEVHDNWLKDCGVQPFDQFQTNGIQLGSGAGGNCWNNQIRNARGMGIIVLGHLGDNRFFNNLIVNAGGDGIFVDDRPGSLPNTFFEVMNNTIVNSGRDALRFYNQNNTIRVYNNVLVGPGSDDFIVYQQGAVGTEKKNFKSHSLTPAKFEDHENFVPKANSPLLDTGMSGLPFGISFDLNNAPRPFGGVFDIGAVERQSAAVGGNDGDKQGENIDLTESRSARADVLFPAILSWQSGRQIFVQVPDFQEKVEATLFDMNGKAALTFEFPPNSKGTFVEHVGADLSSGIYLLEIRAGEQREVSKMQF